jgi:FkbM family methyltransferase
LIRSLFGFIPELPIKNILRCAYYNHFKKFGFNCSYSKGCFILSDRISGISFKTYFNPFWNEINCVARYFRDYRPGKGDIIIDAGAFIGLFTLYAAKLAGDSGKVYAFEPDRANYQELIRNIELNSLSNVVAMNTGLWSSRQDLTFFSNGVYSSFLEGQTSSNNASKCGVTTIDDFLNGISASKVDFIKMDIEGAELDAIRGAEKTLKRYPINLAIASYHTVNSEQSYIKLEKMLGEFGYNAGTDRSTPHFVTYAKRVSQK